ncbi:hypothetical protein [Streptomyces abikoensis]
MRFRSVAGDGLGAVLDWNVTEPVVWIPADRYREESAAGRSAPSGRG